MYIIVGPYTNHLDLSSGGLEADVLPHILGNWVGNVCLPVGIWADGTINVRGPSIRAEAEGVVAVGGNSLGQISQPGQHSKTGMLDLGNLHLIEVEGVGKTEGIEVLTTGVVVTDLKLGESGVDESATVGLSKSHGDDLKGQHVVEAGETRSLWSKVDDLAREDRGHRSTVLGGAQRTSLEPGHTGTDFGTPSTGTAHHGPSAVDELGGCELLNLLGGLAVRPVWPQSLGEVRVVGRGTGKVGETLGIKVCLDHGHGAGSDGGSLRGGLDDHAGTNERGSHGRSHCSRCFGWKLAFDGMEVDGCWSIPM